MPVIMGTALAVVYGGADLHLGRFLAAWAAVFFLHSASNIVSDVADFRRGLDRVVLPVSGAIVRGWFTPSAGLAYGWSLVAAGSLIGLGLTAVAGPGVLAAGVAGVVLLSAYTLLKRVALGDLAVFLAFGPLIGVGAWAVQAGRPDLLPAVWLTPFGLVVIAVLHANNWRDIATDRSLGITTMAGLLGDRGSLAYYCVLTGAPFALILSGIVVPRAWPALGATPMPWTFLLTFLALPAAARLWARARRRHAPRDPLEFATLDGATAQFMIPYGLLSTAAIILARWIGR